MLGVTCGIRSSLRVGIQIHNERFLPAGSHGQRQIDEIIDVILHAATAPIRLNLRTHGKYAHAGSRTRVTSMGGLYDAATLHAPWLV